MNVPDALFRVTGTLLVGAFAYEGIALATRRLPTVTDLCRRYRWLEVAVAAAYLTHMHVLKEIVDAAAADNRSGARPGGAVLRIEVAQPRPRPVRVASYPAARGRWPDYPG